MPTQTVLDLPAITYVSEGDVAYLIRGAGAGRDKQINVEDGLVPKLETYTSGDSINLASYGGDLTVYASNSITLTFSGALRDGKQLVVMNKGAGTITCAGTVTASLRVDESLHGVSDSSAMAVTRHATNDASGNLLAYGNILSSGNIVGSGNITATGTAFIEGAIKSGTTGANGAIQIARTSDGAVLGTFTTDGTDISLGSSTGVLSLQTASTDRVIIDASGNIGFGTNPQSWTSGHTALEIGGICSIFSETTSAAGNSTFMTNNARVDSGWKRKVTDECSFYQQISGTHSWFGDAAGTAGDPFTPTERMRLNINGQLLIGTTIAPADTNFKAIIKGSTYSHILFQTTASGTGNGNGGYIGYDDDDGLSLVNSENTGMLFHTNGATRMIINPAGQLLIGTTIAPADTNIKQTIFSTGAYAYSTYQTTTSGTGNGNGALIGYNNTSGLNLHNHENTGMNFATNNTVRMVISAAGVATFSYGAVFDSTVDINGALTTRGITLDSGNSLTVLSGNIGITAGDLTLAAGNIGITAGDLTLAAGNIGITAGNLTLDAGDLEVTVPGSSALVDVVKIHSGVGECFLVKEDGKIVMRQVYDVTTGTAANVYIDSSGTLLRSTSSRKYKEKERELEMDTSKVYDIEVVTFDMKNSGATAHGPIAEDIAEVEPNFATYDLDGDPEAIHTSNVLYALLEEVKKLKVAQVEDRAEIDMLHYELDQLKGGA